MKMRPRERHQWILGYLRDHLGQVDVYNKDFAEAYSDASGANEFPQFYGAPKVPQLGRDLSRMHRDGKLKRARTGLRGMESGFANWVYCYKIHPRYEAMLAEIATTNHEDAA